MEFSHKIQITLAPDGTMSAKHTCGTTLEGTGKDNDHVVECSRSIPVGGKTAADLTKLLQSLIKVNQEAMETLCGRDTRLTAYVTTVQAAATKTALITGIDIDHNPDEEDQTHAEPGPVDEGRDGGGGEPDGGGTPRKSPLGRRHPR